VRSLDLSHLLPVALQLRGWQLVVDETECAMLSAPGHGGFFVDSVEHASAVAERETQAFDQVQHWLRVERWELRRRTMQRRAVSQRWGSTPYVAKWSQLLDHMQSLRDGTSRPFVSRSRRDVADRRAAERK
jgi:hypothetical protein